MDGVSRKKLNTVGLTWQCWTTKEKKKTRRVRRGAQVVLETRSDLEFPAYRLVLMLGQKTLQHRSCIGRCYAYEITSMMSYTHSNQ